MDVHTFRGTTDNFLVRDIGKSDAVADSSPLLWSSTTPAFTKNNANGNTITRIISHTTTTSQIPHHRESAHTCWVARNHHDNDYPIDLNNHHDRYHLRHMNAHNYLHTYENLSRGDRSFTTSPEQQAISSVCPLQKQRQRRREVSANLRRSSSSSSDLMFTATTNCSESGSCNSGAAVGEHHHTDSVPTHSSTYADALARFGQQQQSKGTTTSQNSNKAEHVELCNLDVHPINQSYDTIEGICMQMPPIEPVPNSPAPTALGEDGGCASLTSRGGSQSHSRNSASCGPPNSPRSTYSYGCMADGEQCQPSSSPCDEYKSTQRSSPKSPRHTSPAQRLATAEPTPLRSCHAAAEGAVEVAAARNSTAYSTPDRCTPDESHDRRAEPWMADSTFQAKRR